MLQNEQAGFSILPLPIIWAAICIFASSLSFGGTQQGGADLVSAVLCCSIADCCQNIADGILLFPVQYDMLNAHKLVMANYQPAVQLKGDDHMMQNQDKLNLIRLGTHGEKYGSWMSNPVFYVLGALLALSVVLAVLSFTVFPIPALCVVFVIAAAILLALLLWCLWIRRQYAFGGGGMMGRTHMIVLSHLDFDGQGQLLEVGCGSGPLSIRAALAWPSANVVGIDYWGVDFGYNQAMCEKTPPVKALAPVAGFSMGTPTSWTSRMKVLTLW